MSNNKEHHYVPQFYLKNFSIDSEKKNISVFNIKSQKYVEKALIRYQTRKAYFYGKDLEIEKIMQKLENEASYLFKEIISKVKLPTISSHERFILLRFILISKERTLLSAEQINEMIDMTIKQIWRKDKTKEEFLTSHNFQFDNAIAFVINQIFGLVENFSTLNIKILHNHTGIDFITSDNPVSPYNLFLERRNHPGGHYGIDSKGIIYFFPITPRLTLIIFDGKTYKIGNLREEEVIIVKDTEIIEINSIIYMHAFNNIYFNGTVFTKEQLELLKKRIKNVTKPNQFVVNEYDKKSANPETTKVLMHSYRTNLFMKLNHSYISIRKNAKRYKIGNLAVVSR